jgi:hypothetical protein
MAQRSSSSFARGPAKFRAQPRALVLCEDSKSSKTYLEDASKYFRATAQVQIAHPGRTDPLGVVEAGVKQQSAFEVVYCVVDRDSHANWSQALNLARNHPKLRMIRSYPCFEFWLLLHFEYTRAGYVRAGSQSPADQVVRDLRQKPGMKGYAKGSIAGLFQKLCGDDEVMLETACTHGDRTLRESEADGNSNPSTEMQDLVRELRKLGTPERVA